MQEFEKIKKIRTTLKLTQQEMADAISVSKQYFSKVENGHTELSKEKVSLLSEKFGISLDWLLHDIGQMFYQDAKNLTFVDDMDIFPEFINNLKAYNAYIVAVGEFIRQKYPNAIVDDILIPTYKLFVDDIVKKEIVYSTNDDVKQNLLDRFSQDENLSQTILNSYFKAYVDRMEKPKKVID